MFDQMLVQIDHEDYDRTSEALVSRLELQETRNFFSKLRTNASSASLETEIQQLLIQENPDDLHRGAVLNLNVGGRSFPLSVATILRRTNKSLLYRFALANHSARVTMCKGYFREQDEYFFERPANLFQSVYDYYLTGECHRPVNICLDLFAMELAFWDLTDIYFANCCWSHKDDRRMTLNEIKEKEEDIFVGVPYGELREKIYNLVEVPESSKAARLFSIASVIAVLASTLTLILGSIPELRVPVEDSYQNVTITTLGEPHVAFNIIEIICIAFFTFEYCSKMIVAPNRRKLFFEPMNIIDLIAILPSYLELALYVFELEAAKFQELTGALLVMRILRVLRVMRLLKLGRHSNGLKIFGQTLHRSGTELGMLCVVIAIGIIFFSTMLYFIEKDDRKSEFYSIPAGFWWCIVTMSTVGYGDMVPSTLVGKLVGSCCIATGALVLALPITVMVENFMRVQDEFKHRAQNQSALKERRKTMYRSSTSSACDSLMT